MVVGYNLDIPMEFLTYRELFFNPTNSQGWGPKYRQTFSFIIKYPKFVPLGSFVFVLSV